MKARGYITQNRAATIDGKVQIVRAVVRRGQRGGQKVVAVYRDASVAESVAKVLNQSIENEV